MNNRKLVYLSGLPRSGSTLLCNILAMHSDVESTPSSYLHNCIINAYSFLSSNEKQLEGLEEVDKYQDRISKCFGAMLDHWCLPHDGKVLIDKNRGWFLHVDILEKIDPNYKIIVTLRDLVGVFNSIEKQHRKTILLKHPEDRSIVGPEGMVMQRYKNAFAPFGLVGGTLRTISDLRIQSEDYINKILNRIYFIRFEDLLVSPQETIDSVFEFIGVKPEKINFENIKQSTHEEDFYYFMKYPHKINTKISKIENYEDLFKFDYVSEKIKNDIFNNHKDYYEYFYPTRL